jgi:hypothetical protein
MSKKAEVVRDYNFSDAALMQLTDKVVINGTRDAAELVPQGVTATRLADLATDNDAFRDMEDDVEWAGLVSEKTEEKNAAMLVCEAGTRNIRRMASNVYGERSAAYRRFGFTGINDLRESERIKAFYRVWRRADAAAADLAPEGLTPTVLSDFRTACEAADDAYDALEDTINDRDIATQERIELGNKIYAEVSKICNTGKTYWFDKDEAKYNDYVISPSGTTGGSDNNPNTSARISGQVTSMNNGMPIGGAAVRVYTVVDGPGGPSIVTSTDANGNYTLLIPEMPVAEEVVIEASAPGFFTQQRNLLIGPGQSFDGENFSLMPA